MSRRSRKGRASALNQPDLFAFADETQKILATRVAKLQRKTTLAGKLAVSPQMAGAEARPTERPQRDGSFERAIRSETDRQDQNFVRASDVDRRLIEYVVRDAGRGRPFKQLPNEPIDTGGGRLLDVREAARRLGLSKSTLDKMRCSGQGPRFIRATDRAIRYDPTDLDAFANERRRRSTSDEALSVLRS